MFRIGQKIFSTKLFFLLFLFIPAVTTGQFKALQDTTKEETYYVGINPIAPFTSIRGEFPSLYLPILSNLETGLAIFVGKFWNRNYNVETRLSYGSPRNSYNLFQVQSGFNYCFNTKKQQWYPYAGMFIKFYSLHDSNTNIDYLSAITYLCVGNRFIWKKYFLDLRLNQNIYGLSWTSLSGSKAKSGFHSSIYQWKSSYIPYVGLNVGILFK